MSNVRFCHGDPDSAFAPVHMAVDLKGLLNKLESEMNSEGRDVVTLLIENYVELNLKELFDDVDSRLDTFMK